MRTIWFDGKKYVYPTACKEVKRHLLKLGIDGNIVKWLGYYDIAVPEQTGKLIPTRIKGLQDLTLEEWTNLVLKAKTGITYLG